MHAPLQNVRPAGHAHAPPEQDRPPVHATPQAPQLALLLWRLTQAPAHDVVPPVHTVVHAPLEHTWPAPHAVPQAPQLVVLERTSTQVLPQRS